MLRGKRIFIDFGEYKGGREEGINVSRSYNTRIRTVRSLPMNSLSLLSILGTKGLEESVQIYSPVPCLHVTQHPFDTTSFGFRNLVCLVSGNWTESLFLSSFRGVSSTSDSIQTFLPRSSRLLPDLPCFSTVQTPWILLS